MKNIYKFYIFLIIFLGTTTIVLAHGWKAPKKAAARKNPLQSSEAVLTSGRDLFEDYCSNCHGEDALGEEDALTNPTAPLNLIKQLKGHSNGDFFWKIKTGRNGMPSFAEELEEEEIWQIVSYLRSLSEQ